MKERLSMRMDKGSNHVSRKFIITVVVIVVATILLITGLISDSNWVHTVEVIGASYIVGNVANSAVNVFKD